jgi:hypothetical protein
MLTTHQIKSAAAVALALGAICAPAASGHVPPTDPPQGTQTSTYVSPVVRVIAPTADLIGTTRASAPPAVSRSRCSASAAHSPCRSAAARRSRRSTALTS